MHYTREGRSSGRGSLCAIRAKKQRYIQQCSIVFPHHIRPALRQDLQHTQEQWYPAHFVYIIGACSKSCVSRVCDLLSFSVFNSSILEALLALLDKFGAPHGVTQQEG